MFTDLAIRKLKPHRSKRLELPDEGAHGLYVCVQPSGAKSFAMRFRRPDGRNARLVLGDFDRTGRTPVAKPEIGSSLTLTEARLLAVRILNERAGGVDVISERKASKLRQRLQIAADKENAFATVARAYYEEHARHETRRWVEMARLVGLAFNAAPGPTVIKGSLCDRWAGRSINKIDQHDIRAVVDEAVKTAVPGLEPRRHGHRASPMGRALHSALSAIFSWAIEKGRLGQNPCALVRRPKVGKSRDRVLSDDELHSIWLAADKLAPQYGAVAKFLILTGARLREIGHMSWPELNDDLTVWKLPAARAKNKHELILPLPKLARDIIASVPRTSAEFVFSFNSVQPVENFSRMKRQMDALVGLTAHWTWHDLRRTTATNLQRLGIRLEVTESVLNHVGGSRAGIVAIYQRYSFDAEKRQALEAWSERLQALLAGRDTASNVVEMPGRKVS
jgi:integrase